MCAVVIVCGIAAERVIVCGSAADGVTVRAAVRESAVLCGGAAVCGCDMECTTVVYVRQRMR